MVYYKLKANLFSLLQLKLTKENKIYSSITNNTELNQADLVSLHKTKQNRFIIELLSDIAKLA